MFRQTASRGKNNLVNRGNLFPEKIPIGLQKVPLTLSGYFPDVRTQLHPHSKTDNEKNANFSRLEIDFIKFILKTLNLTISYDLQTPNNRSNVDFYIELLIKVFLGESDIAVGGLPLDIRLFVIGEPKIPCFETPLSWYVPCAKRLGRTGTIFRVLTFPVWLWCPILFLIATATAWLLAIRANKTESKSYTHIASCCYILWSVSVGVSVPKMSQTPRLIICLSITNKMQNCTMIFNTINALHVSRGSSAHHQELKSVYRASGICRAFKCFLPQAVGSRKGLKHVEHL